MHTKFSITSEQVPFSDEKELNEYKKANTKEYQLDLFKPKDWTAHDLSDLVEDDIFLLKNWNKIEKIIKRKPVSLKTMKKIINKIKIKK
jgi:hypothetical protein